MRRFLGECTVANGSDHLSTSWCGSVVGREEWAQKYGGEREEDLLRYYRGEDELWPPYEQIGKVFSN